jgi:hypothetical protein
MIGGCIAFNDTMPILAKRKRDEILVYVGLLGDLWLRFETSSQM